MKHVVQVSAGDGPVEVRRFVALLAARIEEACEARGLVVGEVSHRGDEDAPWSVEIVVAGDASACLGGEVGTHALVTRSPDRGRAARKRWYAGVRSIRWKEAGVEKVSSSTRATWRSRPPPPRAPAGRT